MNWYKNIIKKAWQRGGVEPLMDEYSRGYRPRSSEYQKDPRSLVTYVPEFGGNGREGYPDDMNSFKTEPTEDYKNRRRIPGEPVLMDDGGDGEGVTGQEFTHQDDKLPIGGDENSVRLDKGLPPKRNIYKKIREKSKIHGINKI